MKIVIIIIQVLFFVGSVSTFFIGIFKPSFLIKRKFQGRRLLLIMLSLFILVIFGMLQAYKVHHVYTPQEREQYYVEREQRAIRDSVKMKCKQRDKFVRDSIKVAKQSQQDSIRNEQLMIKIQQDSIRNEQLMIKLQQDSIANQYLYIISDVKYKNKKVVGIGLDALKRTNSIYVVVAFKFKNNSHYAFDLESDDFRLFDGKNYYRVAIDAQLEAEFTTNLFASYTFLDLIDEVNPQITRKYKLIFEVPRKGNYKLVCSNRDIFIKQ